MRIVQVITSLTSGGAERFVVSISNELVNQGHQVRLVSLMSGTPELDFNRQFLNDDVSYVGLDIRRQNPIKILSQVYRAVNSFGPDAIHCHLGVLQYVLPFVFFPNIRILHTIHNLAEYASGGRKWQVKLYKWLYEYEKVVPITIAEECHKSFYSYYHLSNDILIHNGCEQVHTTACLDEVRKEIGNYKTTPASKVFVHVGRFHKQKNQCLLIDAFNLLHRDGYDFTLLVVGNGFDSSDGCALQERACNRIHFIGEKNNVGDYLFCSDAFCLTSIYEGLPISLLEAMSMGVTSICTPVGGNVNVIVDGKNGYLSKDLSVEEYVNVVKRHLPIDKEVLRKCFKENYSMTICAKKYVSVISR